MSQNAQNIVSLLLEDEAEPERSVAPVMHHPIRIRKPDGTEEDAEFAGYWDFSPIGKGYVPTIGYKQPGQNATHGGLRPGHEILTPIPSVDEWKKWHEDEQNKRNADYVAKMKAWRERKAQTASQQAP